MDENEVDKASQRANLIEQRMFEITLASIDTLKHAAAIELHKSQNEMKKRLRKYRDRQREIVRAKPGFDKDPIEELLTRQMKNKAHARQKSRRPKTTSRAGNRPEVSPRPMTSMSKLRDGAMTTSPTRDSPNVNGLASKCTNTRFGGSTSDETEHSDSESDIEIDGSFMIDQQKSKIDLRPKTSLEIVRRGISLEQYAHNGRLGPPIKQVRYFDEDELKDRGHFYRHLVEKRIADEKDKLSTLDSKVANFCGNETIQTMTRKTQAKKSFFTKNTDWTDNATSKNKPIGIATNARGVSNQASNQGKRGIRPATSVGFRTGSRVSNMSSFQTPSYIKTAH